jgi:8-oxo-dGTP pyrophosphatase MutT (NUDIX family)
MEIINQATSQTIAPNPNTMSFPWQNQPNRHRGNQNNGGNQRSQNTVHYARRRPATFQRPQPGKTEVYGAIIKCVTTNKYCLVQGIKTGKWSFPKGHRNTISTDPLIMEDPFACVIREVGEEIGIDNLPMPIRECPIRVGYYYLFDVYYELPLNPRDKNEVETAGWFTLEEMRTMSLNIDANVFRTQTARS